MVPHVRALSFQAFLAALTFSVGLVGQICGQTSATGAVTGVVLDPSNAGLPGVVVRLIKQDGSEARSTTSDGSGRYGFELLAPGKYQLEASKADFEPIRPLELNVHVTETVRLELHLRLAKRFERTQVLSQVPMVQQDSSALGRVVNENAVSDLPLSTRNFAQMTGLSPGVVVGVYNAGELGLGGTALSQITKSNDGIFVHGLRSYDNNWQLDGISVSDVQGSATGSGGIPLPNPDTIREFKVQTTIRGRQHQRDLENRWQRVPWDSFRVLAQ